MLLNSQRDLVTIPGPAAVSQLVRRAAGRTQRIFHAAFLSHCVVEIDDMNACRSRHTRDSSRSRCIVKWWVRIAARRAATLASALVAVAVNPERYLLRAINQSTWPQDSEIIRIVW